MKWYVITGVLACLLVISVVGGVITFNKVDELRGELVVQRQVAWWDGHNAGYVEGISKGQDQGYDAGYYDGWYQGQWCYEHNIRAASDLGKDWRQYWKEQGIYDKGYEGPLPD